MKSWLKGMLVTAILILFVTGIVNSISLRTPFVTVGLLVGIFLGIVIAAIITLIRDKKDHVPWTGAVIVAIVFFFSSFVVVGQKYIIIEKEGCCNSLIGAFLPLFFLKT